MRSFLANKFTHVTPAGLGKKSTDRNKLIFFPLITKKYLSFTKNRLYERMMRNKLQKKSFPPMDNSIEVFNKAALKFLEPLTPKETYKIIVNEAIKLVHGDEGSIALEDSGLLKIVYASLGDPTLRRLRKKGFSYRVFNTRKALVVNEKALMRVHPELVKIGIKSSILIPLSYKKKTIGVLVIRSYTEKNFSNKELSLLKLFGSLASMAIRKMQLYTEMKKSVEVRDLFISTAAHELRTPLTTVNGYIQLLRSKISEKNFPYFHWFQQLSFEAVRLTLLVNELLEINRIKTGQFQFTWKECNINDIIERAASNFSFSYPKHTLIIKNTLEDSSHFVVADFDKLLQVLSNILNNAGKYSPTFTEIILSVHYRSPYYIIHIEDHGQGIEKEDLQDIFQEFHKGKGRKEDGMGLGLYLAKHIIQQHHGTIGIKSQVGIGTTVTMKLPKAKL